MTTTILPMTYARFIAERTRTVRAAGRFLVVAIESGQPIPPSMNVAGHDATALVAMAPVSGKRRTAALKILGIARRSG